MTQKYTAFDAGRRPSLAINAASNWALLAANTLVAFILTPYLIHHLGPGDYGVWVLLGSIVSMYGLLDMGIGSAIIRYISYYIGRDDNESVNATFNSSFALFCAVGLLCAALTFVIVHPLALFFDVTAANFANFQRGIWFLGLATAISFPGNVLRATIIAHEHFLPVNIVAIIIEVVRFCLSIIAIKLGYGLQGVAFAALAVSAVTMLSQALLCKKFCPDVRLHHSLLKWRATKQLLIYGIPAAITIIAEIFRTRLDSVVVAKWIDMPSVAVYSVGAMLTSFLVRLLVATSGVLDPRFSRLKGSQNHEAIAQLYLKSLSFSTSLAFSVGITLIFAGRALINRWTGTGFDASYTVLVILVIGNMVAASQMPTISLLFALNRHRFCAVVVLLEGLANLALSIFFVRRLGIAGVALGTLIPMVVSKMFILPLYAKNQIGIDAGSQYATVGRPVLVLAAVCWPALYFFKPVNLSWFQLFVVATFSVTVLMTVANWLGQAKEHRLNLGQLIRFVYPKVAAPQQTG